MHTTTVVQIQNEAYCISRSGNTILKGMNPNILLPAMGSMSEGVLNFG